MDDSFIWDGHSDQDKKMLLINPTYIFHHYLPNNERKRSLMLKLRQNKQPLSAPPALSRFLYVEILRPFPEVTICSSVVN